MFGVWSHEEGKKRITLSIRKETFDLETGSVDCTYTLRFTCDATAVFGRLGSRLLVVRIVLSVSFGSGFVSDISYHKQFSYCLKCFRLSPPR